MTRPTQCNICQSVSLRQRNFTTKREPQVLSEKKTKSLLQYRSFNMSWQLTLIGMTGGGQRNVSVASNEAQFNSTTIAQLKQMVLKSWPEYENTDGFRLLFAGKQLEDTMTLAFYKIRKSSTIQIVARVQGGSKKLYSFPQPRLQTQARVHSKPSTLKISTTQKDEIDPYSDDEERVMMSCGHYVGPTSLYEYCRNKLEDKKSEILCPVCEQIWEYSEIRQVALLTLDECKYFESLLSKNHMRRMIGINTCPRCNLVCERRERDIVITNCPACTRKLGRAYEFCWQCGREWTGPRSRSAKKCAHPDCEHPSLKAVQNAVMVTKYECTFPNIRACPICGEIVELSTLHCKYATCPKCAVPYCFLCLRSESECLKEKPRSWYHPCSIPVKPKQTDIPRWIE